MSIYEAFMMALMIGVVVSAISLLLPVTFPKTSRRLFARETESLIRELQQQGYDHLRATVVARNGHRYTILVERDEQ